MYGITVKNDVGHILISSEFESMHCYGPVALHSEPEPWGVNGFTVATWDAMFNQWMYYQIEEGKMSGRAVLRYFVPLKTPVLFFIKPLDASRMYGVLNQWTDERGTWVDIIVSGPDWYRDTKYININGVWYEMVLKDDPGSDLGFNFEYVPAPGYVPVDYSPLKLIALTTPEAFSEPGEKYGMKTWLPNGKTAFDSRLRPLVIHDAINVTSPGSPCEGGDPAATTAVTFGTENNLLHNFRSAFSHNQYLIRSHPNSADLMFCAPSVAQAVRSTIQHGYYQQHTGIGGSIFYNNYSFWWAMYHQAYSIQHGTALAGWAPYKSGYDYASTRESNNWVVNLVSSGNINSGPVRRPYPDKTINLSSNTMLIADSSFYF